MALVSSIEEDEQVPASATLESQNIPRCFHDKEISEYIQLASHGVPINLDKLTNTLNIYLENPILLDPLLPSWIAQLTSTLMHENSDIQLISCQILYQLCKIKGYKSIIKYFPNSVMNTSNVLLETLRLFQSPVVDWTCKYIFSLWMSLLVQCPFDLKKVLRQHWTEFLNELIHKNIRNLGLKGSYGKEMQASAVLLANFLKRPSEAVELESFMLWCNENGGSSDYSLGILAFLVQLGKASEDSVLVPHTTVLNQILNVIDMNVPGSNTITLKLVLKLRSRLAQLEAKGGSSVSLNYFVSALKHRDTVIRWTAAKALRRIVLVTSNSLICKVLLDHLEAEFNSPMGASPHALHGLFLAIGQLLNYKLFNISDSEFKLSDLILKGLKFDQPKGSYAVGSFVRDATCYVVWSLARYNVISESQDHKIISGLCNMSLFDREVAGRRAASAALQEYIGRIGGSRQEIYLPILTHVHFFSVASLEASFTSNAVKIASDLPSLIPAIIEHLLEVSLINFDRNVRQLAADVLGKFYHYDPNLPRKLIQIYEKSDDLFAMHGSLLAMAALPCEPSPLIISISIQSNSISPKALGAELLLEGFLKLISSIGPKANELSKEHTRICLSSWLQFISLGLKSKQEALRTSALISLQALSSKYQSDLEDFFLSCLTGVERERDVSTQMGFLAALGICPKMFFSKNGSGIIKLLIKTSKAVIPINDIEKRCVAIEALDKLINRGICSEEDSESVKEVIVSNLLCDYSIDTRGDVGSKIRLLALSLTKSFPKCPEIDNLIFEQAFGRLDRLRSPAMRLLLPEADEMEDLANHIDSSMPLTGAFRGLIYNCGGLDQEMSERAAKLIIKLIDKRGSSEDFISVAFRALLEERLVIPVIFTVSKLANHLQTDFLLEFSNIIIEKLIPSTQNIRKLLPAFSLLIQLNNSTTDGCAGLEGKFGDFLKIQGESHKFPPIRQLIISHFK